MRKIKILIPLLPIMVSTSLISCSKTYQLHWNDTTKSLDANVMSWEAKKMYTFNVDYPNVWQDFKNRPSIIMYICKNDDRNATIHPYTSEISTTKNGTKYKLKLGRDYDYYTNGCIHMLKDFFKDDHLKFTVSVATKQDYSKDDNYCFVAQ